MNIQQHLILRNPDILAITNLSKSSVHNRIKDGLFPLPISLGARAIGFIASEVNTVIQAWYEEQEQIKELVKQLVANRKANKEGAST